MDLAAHVGPRSVEAPFLAVRSEAAAHAGSALGTRLVLVAHGVDLFVEEQAEPLLPLCFLLVRRRGEPSAGQPARRWERKIFQRARRQIEARRIRRTARHNEVRAIHEQIPLRSHAAEGLRLMRMHTVEITGAVVEPDLAPGCRVEAVDEHAFERPDAGGEIHAARVQHRPAANRPHRDEPAIAEELAVIRHRAFLPEQLTRGRRHAAENAIVGTKDNAPIARDRREPHRAIGENLPQNRARVGGVGGDAVVP